MKQAERDARGGSAQRVKILNVEICVFFEK